MSVNKIKVPDLFIRAIVQSDTFNETDRTVEVVFGTDTPVRMNTWDGPVFEILSFEKGHVNMARLENGAPLLDNHNRYGPVSDTVLGVVESARTDGKKGYAVVRFAKDEPSERAMQKVKDKILRNVSVGYKVTKYERTKATTPGSLDTLRAIEWEPYEISIVPVNADYSAQIRSADKNNDEGFSDVEFVFTNNSQTRNMEKGKQNGDEPTTEQPVIETISAPAPAQRGANDQSVEPVIVVPASGDVATRAAQVVLAAERTRVREIGEAVRAAGLPEDFAHPYIQDGTDINKVRAAIIAKWSENGGPQINPANPAASAGRDRETDGIRAAGIDALFLRSQPTEAGKILTEDEKRNAQRFRGVSLLDMARRSLERQGVNSDGWDKMEIVGRAITSSSSDFPVLLEGTTRRVLLAAYTAIPDTWRDFCKVGSVNDFRVNSRIRTGSFGNLDVINENSEYKTKAIPDGEKENIYAGTKGNLINVSRKMIVNDDLGAFTQLAQMFGRAAARSIESDVYAMFALNSGAGPTMGDGNPLFHASHSNIMATGGAPSVALMDAARVAMLQQKDVSGNDYIDVRPQIWLGPVALGGTVRVVNEAQYDVDVSNKYQVPNKSRGLISKIVDTPRLSGTPWYVLANPMEEPVFEVVFLDGVQTPYLEQNQAFTVDGIQWKVRIDYGVGAIGWRGAQKNAGA